ncbi:MAG: DUF2306 domain-containing protein [Caulobacteraceae bacterium]
MIAAAMTAGTHLRSIPDKALNGAARVWLAAALIGQWVFLYYILAFYGGSTLTGNFQAWTRNHALLKGYIPGDTAGNLAFGAHALLAGYIAFGGAIQLVPWIRAHAPAFHRWNGRVFLATAMALSVTGLYMVWVLGARLGLVGAVGISGNAALIVVFAALAWILASRRDFAAHRRWALRTYMVANGQWFFRVGLFAWIIVNGGPVGIGKNFDGPFVIAWEFGCYLLPLAVLELYLRAKDKAGPGGRLAMAGALALLTVLTVVGIAGVYMFMWRPVLARI